MEQTDQQQNQDPRTEQMEVQPSETRSDLKQKEDHLESLIKRSDLEHKEEGVKSSSNSVTEMAPFYQQQNQDPRMRQIEEEIQKTRSDLKQKENEVESLRQRMEQMEKELEKTRSDLKPIENQVESLSRRVTEMEHFYQQQNQDPSMEQMKEELEKTRSDLKQKENEVESLRQRMEQMEEELEKTRSDLKPIENQVESLSRSVTEMAPFYQQQNQDPRMRQIEEELEKTRSDLKQKENEVESLRQRMEQMEKELEKTRSDLKPIENQVESLSRSVTEMEHFYQQQNQDPRMRQIEEELEKTRSALEEKDEEFKSFKDRVAVDVNLSVKTGKTFESMNSPVSRSRLIEMYEELWVQWWKIKKHLKSNKESPESVKEMIQAKFNKALLDMEKKKKQIDEVFELDELSRGSASERVQQYRQSTCQNLQLVLYHGRKEGGDLKTPSSPHESEKPQDVMESFSSKCYWLGCLMALNNPPLHPNWENHPPSMDKWDFIPRNFTAASEK